MSRLDDVAQRVSMDEEAPGDFAYLVRVARAAEMLPAYIIGVEHDCDNPMDSKSKCSPNCVACCLTALRRALEGGGE